MIVTNVKAIRSMTAMPLIVTNDNSSVNEIPSDPSRASFALDAIEMSDDHVVVFGQRSIERINSFRDLYQTYHQATTAAVHASSPLSRTEMSFRFTILSWWCDDTPISCSSNEASAAPLPPPQLQADSSSTAQEVVVFGIDRHRTGILLTYSVPSEICRAALLPWLVVRGQVYVESACLTALDDVNDIVSFQRSDRTSIVSVVSIDHSDGRPRGKIEIGIGPTPTAGVMVVSADPKQQHQSVLKRHHHHLHDFRSIPKPTKRTRLDLVVAASMSSVHHLETQRKKTAVRFQSLMRPAVDTPIAAGPVSSGSRPDAARVGCRFETPGQASLDDDDDDDDDDIHANVDEEMDGYLVKKTLFPSTTPAHDRRRVVPTHQCSAPSKYAAAITHQWSSLSSLSWILDHELLRYQCLKNSAKCFFSVPSGSGFSPYEQQVERCDRVFIRSAMVMMMRAQQTMEDVSTEACAYLGTIDIGSPHLVLEDVLLVLEDPVTHIKRHAVVNPELFMLMTVPGGNNNNNNNNNNNDGHYLSDGDSSVTIAAAKSSTSLYRWEDSRWNVALSRCAFSDMRSSGEGAMAVLSALSYESLTSDCGDADDASATAVHLTWRVVWMDRVT